LARDVNSNDSEEESSDDESAKENKRSSPLAFDSQASKACRRTNKELYKQYIDRLIDLPER